MRTRTKQLGAKEKARRKKCDPEVFPRQEESRLSEEFFEDWREELVEDAFGPCKSDGEDKPLAFAIRKVEIEATDGGSSRQE